MVAMQKKGMKMKKHEMEESAAHERSESKSFEMREDKIEQKHSTHGGPIPEHRQKYYKKGMAEKGY